MTQLSALDIMPRGAHLGRMPRFRMRRDVRRVPSAVGVRAITSHDRICDAWGFGYRRKYARATVDQGSLVRGCQSTIESSEYMKLTRTRMTGSTTSSLFSQDQMVP